MDFKAIIGSMTAVGLMFFYLMYMPWTLTSGYTAVAGANFVLVWMYYFTLVLGLMIPLYYSMDRKDMAYICLGLSIMINSVVVLVAVPALVIAGVVTLIVGLLYFLMPILEPRMANWEFIKMIIQLLIGLLIVLGAVFFALGLNPSATIDDLLLVNSYNHMMPHFLFFGGGLTVVFGILLFLSSLFKLFVKFGILARLFEPLIKIFYTFTALVFMIGVTYNVLAYVPLAGLVYPWTGVITVGTFPSSIQFFIDFFSGASFLGVQLLLGFLLLAFYIWTITRIGAKNKPEAAASY
ncbi:MAG: hypothetical protein JSW61_10295 [Candidatus Thorarchaeota archaeon]|nr:MAG: hypothetical protein JSW61_10295 [Candidatus Thorarchaeota archaeon]